MPLFEVAILQDAKKKDGETVEAEKLILAPTHVVAKDAQAAAMQIAIAQAAFLGAADPERMKVLVRPFV